MLQKLARQSVPMHLERHLTQPRWPLWTALGAPLPWHGNGTATLIMPQARDAALPAGFVQASKHVGRPDADICYMAPHPERDDAVKDTWRALLSQLITHAGNFGIQRLHACLPAQTEAAEIVATGGFSLYVRETLFQLAPAVRRSGARPGSAAVRPQRETDSFALQRLADRHTPPVVQKAESARLQEDDAVNPYLIFQNWWQPDRMSGLVYEQGNEVVAAVRIRRGAKAHWLHFIGDPLQQAIMTDLLRESLRQLSQDGKAIYCGVRPYQSGLGPILRAHDFEATTELARFVKYTTVRISEPVRSPSRLLIETTFPGIVSTETRSQAAQQAGPAPLKMNGHQ